MAGGRGVEDDEVPALVRAQLEELLHRHVLVAAGEGGRDVAVEAVAEDALAGGGVGRVAGDEGVEGALHVEHHRPEAPPAGGRGSEAREVDRARGLPESWLRPRLVARRREGSMVQTSTRRPERAARRARAAAVVVLPTPPEPQATRMRRVGERRARAPRRGRGGAPSGRLEPARRGGARRRARAPRGRGRAARRGGRPGCGAGASR